MGLQSLITQFLEEELDWSPEFSFATRAHHIQWTQFIHSQIPPSRGCVADRETRKDICIHHHWRTHNKNFWNSKKAAKDVYEPIKWGVYRLWVNRLLLLNSVMKKNLPQETLHSSPQVKGEEQWWIFCVRHWNLGTTHLNRELTPVATAKPKPTKD